MENRIEIPQKIENRTTVKPNNSTSGYLAEENKNNNSKRFMYPYAYCSIVYNS